jgi:ribonucleoside-diphosphate reductase beta chain
VISLASYNNHIVNRLDPAIVKDIIMDAVLIEKDFIRCPASKTNRMNADMMCQYIEYVADRLLVSLGQPKVYNAENPFQWMELISIG